MDSAHILANSTTGENSAHASARAGAIVVAAGLTHRNEGSAAHDGDASDAGWAPLAGRPVLAWAVASILRDSRIAEVVLVVAPDRAGDARALITREQWKGVTVVPADGPRRRDAVKSALHALSPACRWIVVHEATRPLVTPEVITAGFVAAQQTGAAAASEPVKETIKRVQDGVIAETLDRSTLVLLQTPQIFERKVLLAAHEQTDPALDLPDDATLAVSAGIRVATFPSSHDNIAVTTPDDLAVATALLTHGGKQLR